MPPPPLSVRVVLGRSDPFRREPPDENVRWSHEPGENALVWMPCRLIVTNTRVPFSMPRGQPGETALQRTSGRWRSCRGMCDVGCMHGNGNRTNRYPNRVDLVDPV